MSLSELAQFYFFHDEMFVVPIEALGPTGMATEMATLLSARRGVSPGWIELFNASFELYWRRSTELSARAPEHWLPPRLQQCCIATAARRVRPYFQPFNSCSWLLYAGDFDPQQSNAELGAYLFLQMERMGLLRDVTKTLLHNLSYWLVQDDSAVAAFAQACERSQRPDAAGFRALAAALPWIRTLHHPKLSPGTVGRSETTIAVPGTGLQVPPAEQPKLDALLGQWARAAQRCLDDFHAEYGRRGKDRAGELCAWLREASPLVLVCGRDNQILWDPQTPQQIDPVRRTLGGLGAAAAASLRADLEVIDHHSRVFLEALVDPDRLPDTHPEIAQHGLSYLHRDRRILAYNLHEPGMERLRVPAPPYERLMLGARSMHEWGHLAADAAWVGVRKDRQADFDGVVSTLRELFEEIHRDLSPPLRQLAAPEVERLARQHGSLGEALVRIPLTRLADYQANLVARRFLSRAEMETYIRNNVYCLRWTSRPQAFLQRLARYAFEAQYLQLSLVPEPGAYLLGSTWFAEDYLHSGILKEQQFDELVGLVARLCAAQEVDESRFTGD